MWMSYITRPDAIILAVAPAAQDIFADEAIKTALAVDPEGDRTVGACRGRRAARGWVRQPANPALRQRRRRQRAPRSPPSPPPLSRRRAARPQAC